MWGGEVCTYGSIAILDGRLKRWKGLFSVDIFSYDATKAS